MSKKTTGERTITKPFSRPTTSCKLLTMKSIQTAAAENKNQIFIAFALNTNCIGSSYHEILNWLD